MTEKFVTLELYEKFYMDLEIVDTVYRANFYRIFASMYSSAHACFLPTADNWLTAGLCIDDNMYVVTIIGYRC